MAIIPAADLSKSISSFEFDEGKPALSFTRRLARENGWSQQYAQRVVEEYKRFIYLACTASHPVTPSDQIDQAWHLHLTYTRSYWDRFCGQVLKRPLHHEPTRGGETEGMKFADQYERTLSAYITAFRATPPDDIWPPNAIRFGHEVDAVRVPRSQFLIVRRPNAAFAVVGTLVMVIVLWFIAKSTAASSTGAARSSVATLALVAALSIGILVVMGVLIAMSRYAGRGKGRGGIGCGGGLGGCGSNHCGGDSGDSGGSGCGSSCGGGGGGCGGGGCGGS